MDIERVELNWSDLVAAIALLLIALAVLLMFTGCTTVPVPHDVNMAVKTDCHPDKIAVPAWDTSAMTADTGIYDQAKLLLAERKQRQDYEALLVAAAGACQ